VIAQGTTPVFTASAILPELILVGTGLVGLLYEAFSPRSARLTHLGFVLLGLAAAAYTSTLLWGWDGEAFVLGDTVAVDRFSVMARLILIAIALVGCLFYTSYAGRDPGAYRGEFYPLVMFATTGMTLIAAANDLIVVFLALEILSLSLYVLTGITGRDRPTEASVKYFLAGAFASAFFLYGIAMAYGATTSTKITEIANALAGTTGEKALALLAMALLAVGFAFKVSAAPFHMWTPDAYQGAPTPVTAYMSAATKVAAFFALIRVFDVALQALAWDWTPVIYGLAAVSIVLGSVLAIAQRDVKRMLAYSSVAHAGFILTGLTSPGALGIRSAIFYLIAYSLMTLGAFGVVMLVAARDEDRTSLSDYAGLASTSPLLAALMTVFLLSLAGIPPTVGFVAKVGVFTAAIDAGHWSLALIGVIASVAAAFFYLRVIVTMYMREPEGDRREDAEGWAVPRATAVVLAASTLVLGVFPGLLSAFIEEAAVLRW
jgi:NADH-quinone oxidoreductase subunit N